MADDSPDPVFLQSDEDLSELYAPPSPLIQKAMTDYIHDYHIDYLRIATFFCLATGRDSGLDASPRGGLSGLVKVLDRHRVAFADWPGNNRIESMHNLVRDNRVAMLFLFPGLDVFMRINGTGTISADPEVLNRLAEGGRQPKTAIIVAVREVLFHCGKAINRAKLWSPGSVVDRKSVPSVGKVITELAQISEMSVEDFDAHYEQDVSTNLF